MTAVVPCGQLGFPVGVMGMKRWRAVPGSQTMVTLRVELGLQSMVALWCVGWCIWRCSGLKVGASLFFPCGNGSEHCPQLSSETMELSC